MALDPRIKVIGFDMDGTVMDTNVDYVKLAHVVADEFISLGVPMDLIKEDAKTDSMAASIAWLKANNPASLAGFEDRTGERATVVEMEREAEARPFDGAREAIELAISRGYRVALLTRGGRKYATTLLKRFGYYDLFENIVARDDYEYKDAKPSPRSIEHMTQGMDVRPEEILYIGDGKTDWETARNSGTHFIGVESGHMDRSAWEALGGKDIVTIPTVAHLRDLL
ncbi:MAG: HAD family hydrolase [archaeon]|nr:HAD family hydrolase [archaeon]